MSENIKSAQESRKAWKSRGRVEIKGLLKVNVFLLFLPKCQGAIAPPAHSVPTVLISVFLSKYGLYKNIKPLEISSSTISGQIWKKFHTYISWNFDENPLDMTVSVKTFDRKSLFCFLKREILPKYKLIHERSFYKFNPLLMIIFESAIVAQLIIVSNINKINNIAWYNLIDTKYFQMVFRLVRWRCSRALFGNPWSNKSEWRPPEGDNPWNLLCSSRIAI